MSIARDAINAVFDGGTNAIDVYNEAIRDNLVTVGEVADIR